MSDILKALGCVAFLAFTPMAMAQTTQPETPAAEAEAEAEVQPTIDGVTPDGLSMGEEVTGGDGVGSTYIASTHGDWELRCVRAAEGTDPCQLYQLLADAQGNAVAEMSVFGLPAGQQAAAGATVITPLETLLPAQLTLAVDGGATKRYPYTFCAANGCFARIGFTGADVAAFKTGARAVMTLVPAAAPDETVELVVSLTGFTAGFDAVNAANGN